MTSTRKLRKLQAQHDVDVRRWATDTAKALTLTLYQDADPAVPPYNVGVVLEVGEKPWVQIPARCSRDRSLYAPPGSGEPPQPAVMPWLVTNERIVGRYGNGDLRGWRWQWVFGCMVDLSTGREYVQLDTHVDKSTVRVVWYGPGVAPLAVAAVYHLHGVRALLDHPGLAPLRSGAFTPSGGRSQRGPAPATTDSQPGPAAELGAVPLGDHLRF
jgi:hypothetical protein